MPERFPSIQNPAQPSSIQTLEWVLNCPSLLTPDNSWFALVPPFNPSEKNAILLAAQSQLDAHMAHTKSHFLGAKLESLWAFAIQQSERYDLIAQNLQFHAQGRTLGELDFLVYDHADKTHKHQELAIKFYLDCPSNDRPYARWVGPNSIDRLDLKLQKLKDQQLPLSGQPFVKQRLQTLGIETVKTETLLLGQLFNSSDSREIKTEPDLNPARRLGTWHHKNNFMTLLSHPDADTVAYLPVPKPYWMCHINIATMVPNQHQVQPLTRLELLSYLTAQDDDKPQLVIEMCWDQKCNTWIENQRLMLVSDEWPDVTKR